MPQALQWRVREPMPGVVYAPEADLRRYLDAGLLTRETLGDALRASVQAHAQRTALANHEGSWTYREVDEITDRLAAALLDLGLAPLDRVLFQIGNTPELLFGLVACWKAGLIPICTLASHREQEIGYLGRHGAARMHFVQGDDAKFDDVAFANDIRGQIPGMRWLLQARGTPRGGAIGLWSLVEGMPLQAARERLAALDIDPFQVAVFQLSGGTTGVPKIIPRFHNEYVYNMRAVARFCGYTPDDCLFMPMPMMHNLNMGCCFGPFLLTGGKVALAAGLDAQSLGEVFRRHGPTWTAMAGPIVERLKPLIHSGEMPVDTLRGVISANNSPLLRQLLKAHVRHIFGMTEGVIMFTSPQDPQPVQDTMVGRPVSPMDQVRLYRIGTEEEITTPGEVGECAFAGPYTIHGYYDAPERDAQAFTSQGFYRSGDLMLFQEIDGQRYWRFMGRTKDVVDRAGEKVNCEEVEALVMRHPGIVACAVVGMPDPVYGERVCAFVTRADGQAVPTVAELGAFLQQQGLAKFKWPERIEWLPELPLTKAGKLDKPALRERIRQQLAQERS